jgi:tetratricopeptide (TPR) repeat protein
VGYRTITRPLVETLHNAKVRAQIDIVRPGSYRALEDHLETVRQDPKRGAGYYHVIHFDVHGALLSYEEFEALQRGGAAEQVVFWARYGRGEMAPYEGEKAFLFLAGDGADGRTDGGSATRERSDPVEAGELADLLLTHQIPIAILNACQSGKQVGASETSLGSRLVQAGMQMVVAMGYTVTVSAAERLIKTLYGQLLNGAELAVAVRRARQDLYADKSRRAYYGQRIELEDWLLPVLYRHHDQKLPLREFTREEQTAYYDLQQARYTRQEQTAYRHPVYGFFGRDLDILHIETRLLSRRNLLLVRGMGGAGKTTLLHHLGDWWQTTHLVDRVCYFGYDTQAWTLPQILQGIARQVFADEYDTKFKPLASEARQQQLIVETLRSERHLLILDNLESITGNPMAIRNTLPEAEQGKLRRFLTELVGGRTLVLLGSRSGESWLAKETFAENVYELEGLDPEAASQLAETILERQGTTGYRATPEVGEILKLLRGYPLALEVVLSNLTRQKPEEVLASLRAGSVDLDRGDSQEKTQSLLRCIDYSHSNLSEEMQDLLLCLAPFTGVVFQPLLQQYSEQLKQRPVLAGLPFDRWEAVLQEATEWGLLSPSEFGGYLDLQPTLPYFLRSRLNVAEQQARREAIERAFRQHYDGFAGSIYQLLNSKETQEKQLGQVLARLEFENLMTALDLALTAQVSLLEPYRAVSGYLDLTHDEARGLELGEKVLARLESYSSEALSGQLGLELVGVVDDIAKRQLLLKRYAEAGTSYGKALNLLLANQSLSTERRRARSAGIYHQLGAVAQAQREWEQAQTYYQQALQIYIEFNDRYSQAGTYHQLGRVAEEQREWEQAQAYYQQALQICIEFNDRYSQARTYHQLGIVAQEQREWEQARAYYQQALQIKIEFNDRYSQASTYHQLGIVAQEQREWEQAREYLLKDLEISVEFHDTHGTGITLRSLARLWRDGGDAGLPGVVAAVLGMEVGEVEAMFREMVGE